MSLFSTSYSLGEAPCKRRQKLCVVLLVFALVLISQPQSSRASENTIPVPCKVLNKKPTDLGTLVVATQVTFAPTVEWASRANCFAKYGIKVKTQVVASSSIGMAGLVGGSYDLVVNTATNLIQAMANGGLEGKIVAPRHGYTSQELSRAKQEPLYPGELLMQTALIVRSDSEIKSWKDLVGKKVAVQSINGASHAGVLLAMRASGAAIDRTEFLAVAPSQMGVALQRKSVDAVIPNDPFASDLIIGGARVIGYPDAYLAEPGAYVLYVSTSDAIKKNRAAMVAFQKAILESNALLNRPENETSIRDLTVEVTGVSKEAAARLRLPTMTEKKVAFTDLAYLPVKLKAIGFLKTRVNLTPILFW